MTDINDGDELRAQHWDEYVGQEEMKSRLDVHIRAALHGNRMLPNILLSGPPGMGKTTLAKIIATKTGDDFKMVTMPLQPRGIEMILRTWTGGILFLDEIHRASKKEQEDLYSLLLDRYIQLPNGGRLEHPCVTVIAATTEPQSLQKPLYDRFEIRPRFTPYSDVELSEIVKNMGLRIGIHMKKEVADGLGKACGGTPRHARQFILSARALVETGEKLSVKSVLDLCAIDEDGLTQDHFAYLQAINDLGGIAGLDKLSNMTRLHVGIIADLEPLLVRRDLITYSGVGRCLTQAGTHKVRGTVATTARIQRVVATG